MINLHKTEGQGMTDYSELVKALRHCVSDEKGVTKCAGCPYYPDITGCMDRLHTDAAAAIEDLQAEIRESMQKCAECVENEPKRGKWIGVSPMVDTVQCSVCGGQLFSAELETPYCPYCGAKMEVRE